MPYKDRDQRLSYARRYYRLHAAQLNAASKQRREANAHRPEADVPDTQDTSECRAALPDLCDHSESEAR